MNRGARLIWRLDDGQSLDWSLDEGDGERERTRSGLRWNSHLRTEGQPEKGEKEER